MIQLACVQAKNRKERGEPGNIYHVRNMVGSKKLIWANERFAYALWTEYTRSGVKALWRTERD